jgi:hypothetical protein
MPPDEAAAPAANDTAAPATGGSVSDIASFLTERRSKAAETQTREPATPERAGAAEEESAPVGDDDAAAAPEQPPGDDEETDPAGEPPISPPKSWTKAEKDAFASLPREHQQAIADRESERENYYRKGHDEAAQKSRAAEAREQAAEQARQQYEQALPSLLSQFQGQFNAEFSDIKTWDDVREMREADPLRFMAWQEAKEKGASLQREAQQAQQRQQQEQHQRWQSFVEAEDAKFFEKAPEFKDAKKRLAMETEAESMLTEIGFAKQEMGEFVNGRPISFKDHRLRLILRDALRYRTAQKALKAAQPKPAPPVQRPGTSQPRAAVSAAHLRELTEKAKSSGAPRDIAALLTARRKAAS